MPKKTLLALSVLITTSLCLPTFAVQNTPSQANQPNQPQKINMQTLAQQPQLSNDFVELNIQLANGKLSDVIFRDKVNGKSYSLGPNIFSIDIIGTGDEESSGKPDNNKRFTLTAQNLKASIPLIEKLTAKPSARRLVERRNGQRITIPFGWTRDGLSVLWIAEIREGLPYARISITVCSENFLAAPVRRVRVLEFDAPEAIVQGTVKGAPVTANGNRLFAGVEHPLGINRVEDGKIIAQMDRKLDIPVHVPLTVSTVLGVSTAGQLRRTFQQSYINEERARPYAAFLNYNTWYDIGYFDKYDEKAAMNVVKTYGDELVRKRGVIIDSFLFDDGWDDTETLWQFHKGLPNEFKNIRKEAESFGASPGIWFSPWGGYGPPKASRLKAADGKFETNPSGFALSGPKYYEHFKNMCLHMIKENGINHFKLDGTSGDETQIPGSKFSSDFEAIISIIEEMRNVKPDLYVNLTTGTWASPFWFGIADSIWRQNWDHAFVGEGSKRNKWMTHRDACLYGNNVAKSPLFPINSLMVHGVIYTKRAKGLETVEKDELTDEIWSSFGSGTQMQEIYISPSLLTPQQWDTLAAAAKWARANNKTLIDTHWLGGDPAKLEVYGWGSWSPEKGIITLRNPSDTAQQWSCDATAVFELPVGAATKYKLSSPRGSKLPAEFLEAGKPITITLKPFEVIVLEAIPVSDK
ncbi:MAG: enterotoxin [Akkermansia sp.]